MCHHFERPSDVNPVRNQNYRDCQQACSDENQPTDCRFGILLVTVLEPYTDQNGEHQKRERNLIRRIKTKNEIGAAKNETCQCQGQFSAMLIFKKTHCASQADRPRGDHFGKHAWRRKPPLHVAGKHYPDRAENREQVAPDADLSQCPRNRCEQTESLSAPIKRKPTLEIENEKAPQLRTKKGRIIGDRHAHEKRRASGAETRIFDRKRWILACLGEHRRRPDTPFVHAQMLW